MVKNVLFFMVKNVLLCYFIPRIYHCKIINRMNTYIKSALLVLLCLLLSVFCQAQNEVYCDLKINEFAVNNSELGVVKYVSKGEFIFRKMNKNWRILAFTNEDARLITDFFLEKNRVLACEAHYVDKKVKIFAERRDDSVDFPFKKCIAELQEMGYFITSFRSSDEIVVFPMGHCAAAITIHDYEEDMAIYVECPPCGRVIVEEEGMDGLLRVNDFGSPDEEDGLLKMNDQQLFESTGNVKVFQPFFEDTEQTIDNSSLTNNKASLEQLLKDIAEKEGSVEETTEGELPVSDKAGLDELLKDIAEKEGNVEETTEGELPVSEKAGLDELLKDIAEKEGSIEETRESELPSNEKAGLDELLKDIAEKEGSVEELIDSTSMEAIIKGRANEENNDLPRLREENGGMTIGEGGGSTGSGELKNPIEEKLGDAKIMQKKEESSKKVQEKTPLKDDNYEG
ncbi:MAG: hypothetical protein AB8B69_06560 [Chitinophagales bacterium]